MSGNIFKANSRFSILNEEMDFTSKQKSKPDKRNYDKQEYITNSEEHKPGNLFKSNENESKNDISKLIVDKTELKFITIDDFPELKSDIKKENKQQNLDFKSKLTQMDIEEKLDIEDPLLIDLKPGWTLFKREPVSRKTIIREKVDNNQVVRNTKVNSDVTTNNANIEEEIFYNIVDSLSELHKKRTEEYIELNGYYTWHDMYKFPDYNYNYFDALDEEEEDDEDDGEEDQEYDEDDYGYYYEDEY